MFDSGLTKRTLTTAPHRGRGVEVGREGGCVEFGWRIMKSYIECQTERHTQVLSIEL